MKTPRNDGWTRQLGLFFVAMLTTQAVWADHASSFRAGIAALERKNWVEVAQQMQAAIEDRAKEGENVKLYGVRFEIYLPHYYLGLARFQLGDCVRAVAAFEVSEGQGAIAGKALADLRSKKKECQARLPKAVEPVSEPVAEKPAQREPERTARDAVEVVEKPRSEPAPAPPVVVPPPQAAPPSTPAPARPVEPPARVVPVPTPEPQSREPATPTREIGPPPELRSAAEAFFKADYRTALTMLERVPLAPKARATALLLSAAARHALYLEGGGKDEMLRRAAVADVASCRELDRSVRPDPAFFSPKFVHFFDTSR